MKNIINKGLNIYKNHKEGFNYLIAGGIATFLNIGVFKHVIYNIK